MIPVVFKPRWLDAWNVIVFGCLTRSVGQVQWSFGTHRVVEVRVELFLYEVIFFLHRPRNI
jgi:hypothetical protein